MKDGLWPYPDLALLQAGEEVDHPCVRLVPEEPGDRDACTAWGYSRRESGVAPGGTGAKLNFESIEHDDFLKLKAGQVTPGLSGAPLICPQRRAVVGVMTATRESGFDLGGYAVPIRALRGDGPGVPGELRRLGAQILEANARLCAEPSRRRAWNAVLPVPGAERALEKIEDLTFRRQAKTSPADLLRAEFGVVPYLFREDALVSAMRWCEAPGPAGGLQVAQVAGEGGAGKSRFAIELCKRAESYGWLAGYWRLDDALREVPLPRLAVIDYAEGTTPAELALRLQELRPGATDLAPVRIVLITRTTRGKSPLDNLRGQAKGGLRMVLDAAEDLAPASTPLNPHQRKDLFVTAADRFSRAWWPGHGDPSGEPPDLSDDRYGLPLEVLFEAFDHALSTTSDRRDERTPRPSVDRVLDHERKYWQATAPRVLREREDAASLMTASVALATLAGAADSTESDALLRVLPALREESADDLRTEITGWLSDLYDGPALLNPLRPDRLGEALVAQLIRDQHSRQRFGDPEKTRTADHDSRVALLRRICTELSDDQTIRCLEVLARLNTYDTYAEHVLVDTLAATRTADGPTYSLLGDLTERALVQSRGTPDRPGRVDLAEALWHVLTRTIREGLARREPANTGFQRDLSISYDGLADLAVTAGDSAEAERLYRQSLTIREGLARREPANTEFQRDLSISYERLVDLYRDADEQHADVVDWLQRVLAIRLGLGAREPYRADLAEDLAYAHMTITQSGVEDHRSRVVDLLEPFEARGALTKWGNDLLSWARDAG